MSGLLQRLTAQARGHSGDVRPRVPTRFGATSAIQGAVAQSSLLGVSPQVAGSLAAEPALATPAAGTARARHVLEAQSEINSDATETVPFRTSVGEPSSDGRVSRGFPSLVMPLNLELEPHSTIAIGALPLLREPREAARSSLPFSRAPEGAFRLDTATPRDAQTESNEVHVHIGRIEVTAVHEAPRARPAPVRAPTDNRLGEYLRPRGGR